MHASSKPSTVFVTMLELRGLRFDYLGNEIINYLKCAPGCI
jgi:hypothetical protein